MTIKAKRAFIHRLIEVIWHQRELGRIDEFYSAEFLSKYPTHREDVVDPCSGTACAMPCREYARVLATYG